MEHEHPAYAHTQKLLSDISNLKAKQRESFYPDPFIRSQIEYLNLKRENMQHCLVFLQDAFEKALKHPDTFSESNIKKFRVSVFAEESIMISPDYDISDPLVLSFICKGLAEKCVDMFYWTGIIFYPVMVKPKFHEGIRIVMTGIQTRELHYPGIEYYLIDNKPMKDLLESQVAFRYMLK